MTDLAERSAEIMRELEVAKSDLVEAERAAVTRRQQLAADEVMHAVTSADAGKERAQIEGRLDNLRQRVVVLEQSLPELARRKIAEDERTTPYDPYHGVDTRR